MGCVTSLIQYHVYLCIDINKYMMAIFQIQSARLYENCMLSNNNRLPYFVLQTLNILPCDPGGISSRTLVRPLYTCASRS